MNQPNENTYNISVVFKSNIKKKNKDIIQGEPFTWGILIKNIGTMPTPEGKITKFGIEDLDGTYCLHGMDNNKFVRALNPNEEIYIDLDATASFIDGAMWAYIKISPRDETKRFLCHQVDPHHKTITPCLNMADGMSWMDNIYVHKKMEVLQAKTNKHILALTILTSWEAIFGIKDTIISIMSFIVFLLQHATEGVNYILNAMK